MIMQLSDKENQILTVTNIQDFVTSSFHGTKNAICWERNLIGDFSEIVDKVMMDENIMTLGQKELFDLQLTEQGNLAREILLSDMRLLEDNGSSPTLNLIKNYDRDDLYPFFPTDVYSFHVDSSPVPTETILCTYYGDASEIVLNSQATQKILIPEIRQELRKLFDGKEEAFDSFLKEYFFDLHYEAKPDAQLINLGHGHLWRLATDHPQSEVLPCIHRAPEEKSGETRLMMIC